MSDMRTLMPNRKYKLKLDDCCIQGELTGVFLRYVYDDPDDPTFTDTAEFDIGTFDQLWAPIEVTEVDE